MKVIQLPSYYPYNHKIKLEGKESQILKSYIYRILTYKLIEIKKYLEENLKKGFISPSTTPYTLLILFTIKLNSRLHFYIDYYKLNTITKRNQYLIPLIKETLTRVISYKYLIKLDIIATFNKLRIYLESKDLTTFITFIGAYKYYILPFSLINRLVSYQYYINNILFKYLNDFI